MYDKDFHAEIGRKMRSCLGQALSVTHALNGIALPQTEGADLPGILQDGLQTAYRFSEKYVQIQQFSQSISLDQPVDVSALLEAHVRVAESLWMEKDVTIDAYVDDRAQVCVPEDVFSFIAVELVDNACRYAAEGSNVRVSLVLSDGDDVLFEVENLMADPLGKAEIKRIGEPFFRGENAQEAIGVGLSLSCLDVASKSLGLKVKHSVTDGKWRSEVHMPHGGAVRTPAFGLLSSFLRKDEK